MSFPVVIEHLTCQDCGEAPSWDRYRWVHTTSGRLLCYPCWLAALDAASAADAEVTA